MPMLPFTGPKKIRPNVKIKVVRLREVGKGSLKKRTGPDSAVKEAVCYFLTEQEQTLALKRMGSTAIHDHV